MDPLLYEYLDTRFRALEEKIDTVRAEVVANRDHKHPAYVGWFAFITILGGTVGLLLGSIA